jgi:hypothetical protein
MERKRREKQTLYILKFIQVVLKGIPSFIIKLVTDTAVIFSFSLYIRGEKASNQNLNTSQYSKASTKYGKPLSFYHKDSFNPKL